MHTVPESERTGTRLPYQRAHSQKQASGTRRSTVAKLVLALCVVVGWAIFLRPQSLGGRAAFLPVKGISMTPTLRSGDLVLLYKDSSYHVGDIIAFDVPPGQPDAGARVIHRIVGETNGRFVTKGDFNRINDPWRVRSEDVVGREQLRIPRIGRSVSSIRTIGASVLAAAGMLLVMTAALRVHRNAQREIATGALTPTGTEGDRTPRS